MGKQTKQPSCRVSPAEKPLILLVDDFEDNRAMYAEFLSLSGFRVAAAADGREALEQAHALQPDVILMDLSLPGIDGLEATRRLKSNLRTRAIPVLAFTGHAASGHLKCAREAGCEGFIAKPCEPDDLVTQVRRVLAEGERCSRSTTRGRA